ncbi:MAG: aquaporin [Gemmatimonadetes bacterium]|nr:aquaporin [Gemmatimonadota bacterium]
MGRYVTELVGTFFLVFTIGLTAMSGTPMAPIAIGSVLMAMVYMGGHISGAHYNPAVSVAILIRGKMEIRDLVPYVLSQISGAILASLAVMLIVGDTFAPAPAPEAGLVVVLLAEALFTFALSLVVLNVATDDATADNSFYGLAIGFTVMAGAFAVGGISGGVFNPAVGSGPILVDALMGDGAFDQLWIYWVGPLLGGVAAAGVFDLQHPD